MRFPDHQPQNRDQRRRSSIGDTRTTWEGCPGARQQPRRRGHPPSRARRLLGRPLSMEHRAYPRLLLRVLYPIRYVRPMAGEAKADTPKIIRISALPMILETIATNPVFPTWLFARWARVTTLKALHQNLNSMLAFGATPISAPKVSFAQNPSGICASLDPRDRR